MNAKRKASKVSHKRLRDPVAVTIPIGRSVVGGRLLPAIETRYRHLRDVTSDALDALAAANVPPEIFLRENTLVRLVIDQATNQAALSVLVGKRLRYHLARVADWFADGKPTAPPAKVVGDIEAAPEDAEAPVLDAVITCPVVTPNGEIITQAGYDGEARLYYHPDPDLVVPTIPSRPSTTQVREAREFVDCNLFVDFPFVANADRAVAWAAMILPFARPLVDGPTPLHLIQAPMPGSGKTLLAQALMVPALGPRLLKPTTADCDEPEMRKRITALLREAHNVILFDNLGQGRILESSSLAAVLTSVGWSDRILGISEMTSLRNLAVWLATGNNPRYSAELVRRILRSRIDARVERPHMRQGFKHRKLLEWAIENRSLLIRSILIIARAWLAAGKPAGDVRMGMFESWSEVVGGILDVAGVEGLGEAITLLQGAATDTEQAVAPFLLAWRERHGAAAVGVKDLYAVAVASNTLESVADVLLPTMQRQRRRPEQSSERAWQTRLGMALSRLAGHVYDGLVIQPAGTDHSGRLLYRLVPAPASTNE